MTLFAPVTGLCKRLEDSHEIDEATPRVCDRCRAISGSRRRGYPVHNRAGDALIVAEQDISGVVTGPNGPEAGVWVIAETTELPTKFVKIVVTDDRGRYVIPELPKANYNVWVRGYGLVDSPKRRGAPGATMNLHAVAAPDAQAAARVLPVRATGIRCMRVPEKSEFPGTGPTGNGLSPNLARSGAAAPARSSPAAARRATSSAP